MRLKSLSILLLILLMSACDNNEQRSPERVASSVKTKEEIAGFQSKAVSFTGSNGANGEFSYVIDEDWQSNGVLVFLHGSGNAEAYKDNLPSVAAAAKAHGLKAVVVKSASTDSWYKGAAINLLYLEELMQKVLEETGFDKSRVFFAGASGGAVFLSAYFVPSYGYLYSGGAVHLCGGEESLLQDAGGGMTVNPAMRSAFPIYFLTQTGDYMLPQVRRAETFFTANGLRVVAEYPAGDGHCNFDMGDALRTGISKIILP